MLASAMGSALFLIRPLIHHHTHRYLVSAVVIFLPLAALGLYVWLGAGGASDQPLAPRLSGDIATLPPQAAIIRLQQELRGRTGAQAAQGWSLLARLRYAQGAYEAARVAWQRVQEFIPNNSDAYLGQARAQIARDGGVVSPASLALFEHARQLAPDNVEMLYYIGMAYRQLGQNLHAIVAWEHLIKILPADAPIRAQLMAHIVAARADITKLAQ